MKPHEDLLRDELRRAVSSVAAPEGFVSSSIAAARAARRRRRRAMAAMGVLTVLAGAVAIPMAVDRNSPIPAVSGDSNAEREPAQSASDWASSLPQGPPTTLPFALGGNLHVDDEQQHLDATGIDVIGESAGGWILLLEHDSPSGEFSSEYVELTTAGRIRPLPDQRPNSDNNMQDAMVSPDGRLVAYGQVVVDISSQRVIEQLPRQARFAVGWTTVGLLYADNDNQTWLWEPGERPISISDEIIQVATEAPRAVTRAQSGDCGDVVELAADGTTSILGSGCSDDRPVVLSSDGEWVITAGMTLTAVGSATYDLHALPADAIHLPNSQFESPGVVVFPIEETAASTSGSRSGWLVRCFASSGNCERAGNMVEIPVSESLDVGASQKAQIR